ncbi:MAG: S8 family serine peptidase [Candidatus Eisenbacteria bacterium]
MRKPAIVLVIALLASAAPAAGLDMPVWRDGMGVPPPAFYRGDVLEIRLAPSAASSVHPRGAPPTSAKVVSKVGVAAVDRVAAAMGGATFRPEFRGEIAPDWGDDATDFTAFHLVHLPQGTSLQAALDAFRALPEVASADPIAVLPTSALPDDSLAFATLWLYRDQPVRHDIRAPEAWQITTGDTSLIVGIVDTGVIPYHPDLGGRGERGNIYINWAEKAGVPGVDDDGNGYIDDFSGWDFVSAAVLPSGGEDGVNEDNDPNDWVGHGTACAGIVGALAGNGIGLAGVAPQVRILPLRIGWLAQGATPPNGSVDMSYAAAAIRYATRLGAHVLNASFTTANQGGLDAAVTAATRAGVVIVNASGNNGSTLTYMAQREDVIAVSGADSLDVIDPLAYVKGPWVDLCADATGLVSTFFTRVAADSLGGRTPAYRGFLNGTSFAAPQVSGAVVLLQAQRRAAGKPLLTPVNALLRLRETTTDISALNPGVTGYGTGRLDLFRMLTERPTSYATQVRARTSGPNVVLRFDDGRTRVVYVTTNNRLLALDGPTGDTVWVAAPSATLAANLAGAELGKGRGFGLFVGSGNGSVLGFREDGVSLAGWPARSGVNSGFTGGISVGDLDGDGEPEIVASQANGSVWAFGADGTVRPGFPFDTAVFGPVVPALGDLDGIAGDEIAFIDGASQLTVLKGDGGLFWQQSVPLPSRAPVLARLASPSEPLCVLVASPGQLTAYHPDGALRWQRAISGNPSQDPALVDLDGDGVDEIVLAMANPLALAVFDSLGAAAPLPGWPKPLGANVSGPIIAGPLQAATHPAIAVFSSVGLKVYDDSARAVVGFPKPGLAGQWSSLADLDGDGATEIAAGAGADSNAYTYDAGPNTWSETMSRWATPRGDYARTASAAGDRLARVLDRTAPAPATNLVAEALTTTTVRVSWMVSGDDGFLGQAARVELRYQPRSFSPALFPFGVLVATLPPGVPGSSDSVVVTGLEEGSVYYFALVVQDEVGNRSAMSLIDTVLTPGFAPTAVADLRVTAVDDSSVTLAWTATGDDGVVGTPASYTIAANTSPLDDTNFDSAPVQFTRAALVAAGGAESQRIAGLIPGQRYWFRLRATDRAATRSGLSNEVAAATAVGGAIRGRVGIALAARSNPSAFPVSIDWQGVPAASGRPQWLSIHDLSGRVVRRFMLGTGAGGTQSWDGRDDGEEPLPAGLYFARLESAGSHAETKLVITR